MRSHSTSSPPYEFISTQFAASQLIGRDVFFLCPTLIFPPLFLILPPSSLSVLLDIPFFHTNLQAFPTHWLLCSGAQRLVAHYRYLFSYLHSLISHWEPDFSHCGSIYTMTMGQSYKSIRAFVSHPGKLVYQDTKIHKILFKTKQTKTLTKLLASSLSPLLVSLSLSFYVLTT